MCQNLMSNTYLHAIISSHFKFLTLGLDVHFTRGYSNVEFDVMYFL